MLAAAATFGGFAALIWLVVGLRTTKLQTLESADDKYVANLSRIDGIDRNYVVKVNGARVYTSPDFAPANEIPFRESLAWDASGKIVVLEVAGHRIFGYDCVKKERLSDAELLAIKLAPDSPLWKYHYESEWPGIGRITRPESSIEQNTDSVESPASG
jgi:hypothetical protein